MAKKKAAPKKRGRPATGKDPIAIQIRGPAEWKAWVEEFARDERTTVAGLVDRALEEMAARRKRTKPPGR